MTCAACQIHVEHALRDTPGVSNAQVNLMSQRARVTYDPTIAQPEQLIGAVRDAGYDAVMPTEHAVHAHDHDDAGDESTLKVRALATIIGGGIAMILSMPLMHGHGNFSAVPLCMSCRGFIRFRTACFWERFSQ
jgi:Cu+-exporting ATPase